MDRDRDDDRLDRDDVENDATRDRDRDRDRKKSDLEEKSPGAKLHFGSAGSGGAEYEQIPGEDEEP